MKFDEYSQTQYYDAIQKHFGQNQSLSPEYRTAICDWIEREQGSEHFRNAWTFHEAKYRIDKWKNSGKTITFEEKLENMSYYPKTLTKYVNRYNTFREDYNSKRHIIPSNSFSRPSTGNRQNNLQLPKSNNTVDTKNTSEGDHVKIYKSTQQSSTRGKPTTDNASIEMMASFEKINANSSSEIPFGQTQPAASTKTAPPPPNGNKNVNNQVQSYHGDAGLLKNTEVLEGIPIIEPLPPLTIADLPPAAPKVEPIKQVEDFFEMASVSKKDKNATNILLVGSRGVGKTNFISSCANLLNNSLLNEAVANPIFLDKVSFEFVDSLQTKTVEIERNVQQSEERKIFTIRFQQNKEEQIVNFMEQSAEAINLEEIDNFSKNYGKINVVCLLLKSNFFNLQTDFRSELKKILDKSKLGAKEIIFCFSNTATTGYKPGSSLSLLRNYLIGLKDSHGVSIAAEKENIICFDNEFFRYLCIKKCYPDLPYPEATKSWNQSQAELKRIMNFGVVEATKAVHAFKKDSFADDTIENSNCTSPIPLSSSRINKKTNSQVQPKPEAFISRFDDPTSDDDNDDFFLKWDSSDSSIALSTTPYIYTRPDTPHP